MDTLSGIYHPRNPYESPFYHCIADHFEEFIRVYDERYERDYGFFRPVIAEVIEKFLACDVPHQHYVFTIPKIIRPYFKYDCSLLGKLCLCAWNTIKEFFGTCLPEGVVPGAVISIQTWGDTANPHQHS